jgi:predicted transcriptional regulator
MTVSEIVNELGLTVFCGADGLDNIISGGYVSDLLSDVMGNASENQVWITLQTHNNVAAVASLKELSAVILVKGLIPEENTRKHCEEERIPLLGTSLETFEIAGKLYMLLQK